ncbi:hypothetical protein H6F67_18955 [Microcoleus sp. FACHB-1515]|uniref:hypothetical protein n=1 Tax=Cyanophyceae TaxID=3028117 RepID=UPI0016822925|nr:hypothetical protein [Microcoleus sp. FACHB-1515]MBD2091928.1 hypothetical protein [Microcoleus sp. FACHB-1515]
MFAKTQKFAQFRQSDLNVRINRSRFFGGDGDDSIDDARDLGRLKSSLEDGGRVSENDPDYYKFTLKKDGIVKFNFKNSGDESIQFSVVDKRDRTISVNGTRLFAEVDDGDKIKFSARLSKGAYFLKVDTEEGRRERFNIKLKLESSRNDDSDDD